MDLDGDGGKISLSQEIDFCTLGMFIIGKRLSRPESCFVCALFALFDLCIFTTVFTVLAGALSSFASCNIVNNQALTFDLEPYDFLHILIYILLPDLVKFWHLPVYCSGWKADRRFICQELRLQASLSCIVPKFLYCNCE